MPELERLLAQSRQETRVLQDQIGAMREQLRVATQSAAQLRVETQDTTRRAEALGYVATLDSHRVSTDAPLVRFGAERAIVRAQVVREERAAVPPHEQGLLLQLLRQRHILCRLMYQRKMVMVLLALMLLALGPPPLVMQAQVLLALLLAQARQVLW